MASRNKLSGCKDKGALPGGCRSHLKCLERSGVELQEHTVLLLGGRKRRKRKERGSASIGTSPHTLDLQVRASVPIILPLILYLVNAILLVYSKNPHKARGCLGKNRN